MAKPTIGAVQPSPLAGEGGERRSRSPGEGDTRTVRERDKPAKTSKASPRPAARGGGALRTSSKIASARQLRGAMTDAERRLWSLLRNRKLVGSKFRRQVPVGPYVADFLCFEARLIVEVDGGQHTESPRDEVRDAWLRSQRLIVLRLWNSDVLKNPEGVLAALQAALATQSAPHTRKPRARAAQPS